MSNLLHDSPKRASRWLWFAVMAVILAGLWSAWKFMGPKHPVVPVNAIADNVDLMTARDFTFKMGSGGRRGFNTMKIEPNGRCHYTFFQMLTVAGPDGGPELDQRWRSAEFDVDEKTFTELRRLLIEIDFLKLNKDYVSSVLDGTQRWAKVEMGGKSKSVYCSNYFPPPFERLHTFVKERILLVHEKDLENVRFIDLTKEKVAQESLD